MFELSETPLAQEHLEGQLINPRAGAFVAFTGWVRNHNEGKVVSKLEYQTYEVMAVKEGAKIIIEAEREFDILQVSCVHRIGLLDIGELAVWVGVTSIHRGPAFEACEYVINELKTRVPIWKKEYYPDGDSGWVNCERCGKRVFVNS